MKIPNILSRKPKVAIARHNDSCGCRKCLGMDIVDKEMLEIRRGIRENKAKDQWIANRDIVRTQVRDVTSEHIVKLIGEDKLNQIQNSNSQKVFKKSNKYFKALFGVK